MGIIEKYSRLIIRKIDGSPGAAERMIRIGLKYEDLRLRATKKRGKIPVALNILNRLAIRSVADALAHPEKTVWANIFAPTELLTVFGLKPLSIECFAAFMGGFKTEDHFLRRAEAIGMSDTLCSYHKCFIGAADSGVMRRPLMSLTTTLACDANVNTFRYLEKRLGVESFVIDTPFEYTDESLRYVSGQLCSLISRLEEVSGRRFDEDALKAALARENEARALQEEAFALQAAKIYPTSLTLHLFKLFATHVLCGSEGVLGYYRALVEDLKSYPDAEGADKVNILWAQLMPYYQETLKNCLGGDGPYHIVAKDFDFDYGFGSRLDTGRPIEALAKKILLNPYNGPFRRRIEAALEMARLLNVEGAIMFCHWGCKQSAGGALEMKSAFDEAGIPLLILDGDGIDKRNDAPGQIKTRAEAFFEMLAAGRRDPGDTGTGSTGGPAPLNGSARRGAKEEGRR